MRSHENLLKSIDYILSDFKEDDDANTNWRNQAAETRVDVPYEIAPVPYAVFIVFVYIKKYPFGGQWEKVNWEIPIKYKGTPFLLSHRKFGFRLLSPKGREADYNLAIEAIHKINKAIPIAEKIVEPYIKSLVNEGEITVPNEYIRLRDRYNYFRETAVTHYRQAEENRNNRNKDKDFSSFNQIIRESFVASHNVTAMLDAYYSYLEHILVLVKPFVHLNRVENNLSAFIGMTWSDKFKKIFDIKTDKVAKNHYDALYDIKESYRNVLSHGNFQKAGGSLSVHMKNLGAIPMHLTRSKSSLSYGFGGVHQKSFEEMCQIFDSFDTFMEKGTTRYGVLYAKSGLYLAFDNRSKKMYEKAMISDEEFHEFIKYTTYMQEQAANMDW